MTKKYIMIYKTNHYAICIDVTELFNVIDVTDFPQFKLNFLNIFVM